jgi:hypothetical protein
LGNGHPACYPPAKETHVPASPHRPRPLPPLLRTLVATCAALALVPAAGAVTLVPESTLDANALNEQLGAPYADGAALVRAYAAGLSDKRIVNGSCEKRKLETPFTPWLDRMSYWRLPMSTAWTRSSNVVLTGTGLTMPAGHSATTPAFCIGIASPTFRFVAHSGDRAVVRVEILTGNELVIHAGRVQLTNSMAPSPVLLLAANALALQNADYSTSVRIRFVVESGTAGLDALWIDPFKRI